MSYGIFKSIEDAIEAARVAQQDLYLNYTLEDRDNFIAKIRVAMMAEMEDFAREEFEETGYGRIEDKIAKNTGAVMLSQGTEAIPQNMYASDKGLTVEYYAPYGVLGAVTPVTNPAATIVGNGLAAVASGNSVVFNAHPNAKKTSTHTIQTINKAIVEAGGPDNLLTMAESPDMETLAAIMNSPTVKLLVGTGGPGMVNTLMRSGKKVVAAGAGNPPSIVDDTVDLAKAAEGLYGSASFDNNLLCIAEKEVFVLDSVFDAFVKEFEKVGARYMTREDADKVIAGCILKDENGKSYANKIWIGKCANKILEGCGVKEAGDPRIAFYEANFDEDFVQLEQMMPILPFVRCKTFEEALELAYKAEHDCKHSASIWSNDIDRVTKFGKMINTTIYVQNGLSLIHI